ncbi:MAG: heme ABC exporter ATP-binding protein CcmA [Alphaproteobacteria bacterium]|nr:heme ABC exporter ATP-binding protein CcmA [Alphaproteobacteria bacterium]
MLMELHIQGLNFSYGEKKVFEDTNIDLSADKITVLFGKNGTGKSTLLKLIAGIERCDSGNISFSDKNGSIFSSKGMIAYLGHKLAIKEELTVEQNISFWSDFYQNTLDENNFQILEMDRLRYLNVSELSQGQKKKLAFIRVLLSNKPIWLLDEPLSNLDIDSTKTIKKLISNRISTNNLVLVTSHSKSIFSKEQIITLGN